MDELQLYSPDELKQQYPLTENAIACIRSARETALAILSGHDERLLLIVGPCSIHNTEAALEYAQRLMRLAEEVKDTFFVVMRTFFEKPRTSVGWKGLAYDPHLNGSCDIAAGLALCRSLLVALNTLGLPCATEFLHPLIAPYFSDCISWGSIGARTCQSPIHREFVSGLKMPIGFKNRTDGDIDVAIQGIRLSSLPQRFLSVNSQGRIVQKKSAGNPLPHLVLRGGSGQENYHPAAIQHATHLLTQYNLPPALIVDCSHDNCRRNYQRQEHVFGSLMRQVQEGNRSIRGLMLESFLLNGTQDMLKMQLPPEQEAAIAFGGSLTDPCLGWEATEDLIMSYANFSIRGVWGA